MGKSLRTAVYDSALGIEACRFRGVVQPFPSHFHDYYVIGLVDAGERSLTCRERSYTIRPGHLLLFNPGDSHGCTQRTGALDYRSLHISREAMARWAGEAAGQPLLPHFPQNVLWDPEAAWALGSLHELLLAEALGREEALLLLLSQLLRTGNALPMEGREGVRRACAYMEDHLAEHITLEELCLCAALSRSTLLRAFTREKGVTPYRYLESLRIDRAKRLLERGCLPVEAALRTGFADQSHFTNAFTRFIGLPPGAYRSIFPHKE